MRMNETNDIKIRTVLFRGRKNIDWDEVRDFLKQYQGKSFQNEQYKDIIKINFTSIDEYTSSRYTRGLRGTLAKAKANLAQILPEILSSMTNRRWVENNDAKHENHASKGWYRYDSFFALPVQATDEESPRWNSYRCTVIVNANDKGLFLYDVINIKKEVSNPR